MFTFRSLKMNIHPFAFSRLACLSLSALSMLSPCHASPNQDPDLEAAMAASLAAAEENDQALLEAARAASLRTFSLNDAADNDLALALAESASSAAAMLRPATTNHESDLARILRESAEAERRRQEALAAEEEAMLAAALAESADAAGVPIDQGSAAGDAGPASATALLPIEDPHNLRIAQDREYAQSALVDLDREEERILNVLQESQAIILPAQEAFNQAQRQLANDTARLTQNMDNPRLRGAVAASQRLAAERQRELTELEASVLETPQVREMRTRLDEIAALRVHHQQMLEQG